MSLEVKIYKGSDWYVYLYDPTEGRIVKKFYKGLNRIQCETERLVAAETLKRSIERELKSGWVPSKNRKPLPKPFSDSLTISDAYQKAAELLALSTLARKTKQTYLSHFNAVKVVLLNLKWDSYPLSEFQKFHFHSIISEISGDNNGKYNKHLAIAKAFFSLLVKEFIIQENPVHGISEKKHIAKVRSVPTPDEQRKIINHFEKVRPAYLVWLKVLYHIKIRPGEMRNIKCSMVNSEKWYFQLPGSVTKNSRDSLIIIPDDLRKDLMKLDLSIPDYYLFGAGDEWFTPSEKQLSMNASSKIWREEVKMKLGLSCDQYSISYKGANDKLKNGMAIDDIRDIMRHSDTSITKIYATEELQIRMEKNRDKFGNFE